PLTRRRATFGGTDGGWNGRRWIAGVGRPAVIHLTVWSVVRNRPLRVRDCRDRGDKRDHGEAHRSSPPVGDPPQSAVRHLVVVDLFVWRPIPTTLFQITPEFASGSEGHMAVDAFVCSDNGKDLGMVTEDHEASPTGGSAIAC